jgi:hypothetical protein
MENVPIATVLLAKSADLFCGPNQLKRQAHSISCRASRFSASLTRTPPPNTLSPSVAASAVALLIWSNQHLKAATSPRVHYTFRQPSWAFAWGSTRCSLEPRRDCFAGGGQAKQPHLRLALTCAGRVSPAQVLDIRPKISTERYWPHDQLGTIIAPPKPISSNMQSGSGAKT